MEKIDARPTDTRDLDELHEWSRRIVPGFEHIESGSLAVCKGKVFITKLRVFEIIFCRLNIIEFAIGSRSDDIRKRVTENDDIIRESILHIWRSIRHLDSTDSWTRDISRFYEGPGFWYLHFDRIGLREDCVTCSSRRTRRLRTRKRAGSEEEYKTDNTKNWKTHKKELENWALQMNDKIEYYKNQCECTADKNRPFLPREINFWCVDRKLIEKPSDHNNKNGVAVIDNLSEYRKWEKKERKSTNEKKKWCKVECDKKSERSFCAQEANIAVFKRSFMESFDDILDFRHIFL